MLRFLFRWQNVVLAAFLVWTFFWLLIPFALAHDHERPELNAWFQNLRNSKGYSCCDGSEALHLHNIDWVTQNKPNSHFRVKVPADAVAYGAAMRGEEVETIWVDVPDESVVTESNKAGEAMVWPLYGVDGLHIRCFAPGEMT